MTICENVDHFRGRCYKRRSPDPPLLPPLTDRGCRIVRRAAVREAPADGNLVSGQNDLV